MNCSHHKKLIQTVCNFPNCVRQRGCEQCKEICIQSGHFDFTKVVTSILFFDGTDLNEGYEETEKKVDFNSLDYLLKEDTQEMKIFATQPQVQVPSINALLTDLEFSAQAQKKIEVWKQVDLIQQEKVEVEIKQKVQQNQEVVNQYDEEAYVLEKWHTA